MKTGSSAQSQPVSGPSAPVAEGGAAAAHTPGPWVIFADKGRAVAVMPAGRRGDICFLDEGSPVPEREANARLIAAAPDMLRVLGVLLSKWDSDAWTTDQEEMAELTRAAITIGTVEPA